MKGRDDISANMSSNTAFREMLSQGYYAARCSRAAWWLLAWRLPVGRLSPSCTVIAEASTARLSFQGIPVSTADQVVVPSRLHGPGAVCLGRTHSDGPAFKSDASNTAAEQMLQAGMHHDAIHFFPAPYGIR